MSDVIIGTVIGSLIAIGLFTVLLHAAPLIVKVSQCL